MKTNDRLIRARKLKYDQHEDLRFANRGLFQQICGYTNSSRFRNDMEPINLFKISTTPEIEEVKLPIIRI